MRTGKRRGGGAAGIGPAAMVGAILAALALAAASGAEPAGPPVITQEADQKAAAVFESLYGEELKAVQATPATADDVALAAKLLEAARSAGGQPALVAVLCQNALQLGAVDPKGYDTALAAVDLLASIAPDKAAGCQETVLAIRQRKYEQATPAVKARAGQAYIDQLMGMAAASAGAGDLDDALKLAGRAGDVARAIQSASLEEAIALVKQYTGLRKVAADVPRLKAAVAANPAGTADREQLIRLLLIELDNPREAAAFLDESCDPALRKYVPAAVQGVDAAPEAAAMELADWYRGLAAVAQTAIGKRAVLARAAAYYQRFLDQHSAADLDRTKAELALAKTSEELGKLGGAPASGASVDLLKLVDLARDGSGGRMTQGPDGLVLPYVTQTKLRLPVAPTGDYEIEVGFTRTAGNNSVCLVLPVADHNVTVMLNGHDSRVSGLDLVNDKTCDQNETMVKGPLVNGRAYTLNVRVSMAGDKATIVATLDGKPFIKWTGPPAALSTDKYWAPADPKSPVFGGWDIGITLHSARIRMLSGKAAYQGQSGLVASAGGLWTDLLRITDPKTRTVSGTWSVADGVLTHKSGEVARIQVPASPTGNYDLSVTFNRKAGAKEFCVLLPAGKPAEVWVGGGTTGQSGGIGGVPAKDTPNASRIVDGHDQRLDIKVILSGDNVDMTVNLDGMPYLAYKGPVSRLSVNSVYAVPQGIGLAVHSGSTVEFKSVRIRALTGKIEAVN